MSIIKNCLTCAASFEDRTINHNRLYCNKKCLRKHKMTTNPRYQEWYKDNARRVYITKKEWCDKHREQVSLKKKEWYRLNKQHVIEQARIRNRNKRKIDINYRLSIILRNRLWYAIKNNYKAGSAVRDLGCTISELKSCLESKFQPGMTWGNYGSWHIDHIRPLSLFNLSNRDELLIACNHINLQPLWAIDNIRKSNNDSF